MTLYTKPASPTPFDNLPPELATVIFDLVSANCRPNAANCRLVCQDFHTSCSPFLIRTIVIAERYETLRKARELLIHPYFSKHITHLLWDASYYDEYIAADFHVYQAAFNLSKHLWRNGQLVDYNIAAPPEDERGKPIRRHPELFESEDDTTDHPKRPQSRLSHSVEMQETGYLQACQLGHSDYFRRWVNQESVRGRDLNEGTDYEEENGHPESEEAEKIASGVWDIDGNLAQFYFCRAVDELPNLRHIVYGDYRALAFDGETYAKLCRRLFKSTVCPTWAFTNPDSYDGFLRFMHDLKQRRRSWLSVSIGRHPFETSYIDQGGVTIMQDSGVTAQSDVRISYDILFGDESNLACPKLQVRSLKLPILVGDADIKSFGRLSDIIASGLVELDLGVTTFSDSALAKSGPDETSNVFRPLLVQPQPDFASLQSIPLRGFIFSVLALQELLLGHSSMLRTLRLIDCYCPDSHDAFETFAKNTVAPALTLNGVEVYGLRFKDAISRAGAIRHIAGRDGFPNDVKEYRLMRQSEDIYDYETLTTRPNTRIWHAEALKNRGRLAGLDMLTGWPYERPELEDAMLGGRKNNVLRRIHTAPTSTARNHWHLMPISYE